MRKLMLTALAIVIGTASSFATINTPDVPKKEIRSQIVKLLDTPEFTVENDIQVALTFTFSSEGEVVVLSVDSKNREVLNYIRKQLNYKKIANPGEKDELYSMVLKVASAR